MLSGGISVLAGAAFLAQGLQGATAIAGQAVGIAQHLGSMVSALAGAHLAEALLEGGDPEGCRERLLAAAGGPGLELLERAGRARYYEITARGRKHLTAEANRWRTMTAAIGRVLGPALAEG